MQIAPDFHANLKATRRAAEALVDSTLGPYVHLKNTLQAAVGKTFWWVRDITLSNTMWGNRAPVLDHPRAGVHALGGGIGQGLAMGIGVALANQEHALGRKTVVLAGDGGFMLNVGELACAAQERADVLVLLMNDSRYGVIKNIQDAVYGSRHCYVELHNPEFAQFCASLQVAHHKLTDPAQTEAVLRLALQTPGPVVVEVDMAAWGSFPVNMRSQQLTLIGFGAIGRAVYQRMQAHPAVQITHIVVSEHKVDALQAELGPAVTVTHQVPQSATLALECAGHTALTGHILPALQRGVECAVLSIG
eukprot:gene49199-65938_t